MTVNPATALEPDQGAVCPSCGAAVLTGMSWCTLCYASLVPPPPVPAPVSAPSPAAAGRPADAPTSDLEPVDVEVIAARLLAELAATPDPNAGWTTHLPRSSGAKAAVIIGGAVVGSLVLVVLMALLGLFL